MMPTALGADETPPPPPEMSSPFEFIFFREPVAYHRAVEGRLARGTWGKGPVAVWMRTLVPLVEGETPSGIQRALILADSASGVAVVVDHRTQTFVNADLTVALHRAPEGEWICLDAATIAEPHGVGLTRARLWDAHGPLGVSLQNCLLDVRSA
jgi:acyl-CoA thioesterase